MNRGLIVSCQALPDEPLHSPFIMGRMALAAFQGGAIGIRANGVSDIKEIKKNVSIPIIGIIKKNYENLISYITPTLKEVSELYEEKIDVIAVDATTNQDLDFLKSLKIKFPNQMFMADISTVSEGLRAHELGFDFIGTTLVGYTKQSKELDNFFVLDELIKKCSGKIVAEGNFDTPEKVKRAISIGAYSVVVGGAITRPQLITRSFVDAI